MASYVQVRETPALTFADSIHSVPWMAFRRNAGIAILFTVVLPCSLLTAHHVWMELNAKPPQLERKQRPMNVDFFDGFFIWLAIPITFLIGFITLMSSPGARVLFSKNEKEFHKAEKDFTCHVLMIARTFGYLLLLSCLPAMTCLSPCLWWKQAALTYSQCRDHCFMGHHENQHLDWCHFFHNTIPTSASARIAKRADFSSAYFHLAGGETTTVPASKQVCIRIISHTADTKITELLMDNHKFLAFESKLRTAADVTTWDIYGPTISGLILSLLAAVRFAIHNKKIALKIYRNTFLKHNILRPMENASDKDPQKKSKCIEQYVKLFERMYALQGMDPGDIQESYIIQVLKHVQDNACEETAFATPDNEDAWVTRCGCRAMSHHCVAFLYALGQVAIVYFCRDISEKNGDPHSQHVIKHLRAASGWFNPLGGDSDIELVTSFSTWSETVSDAMHSFSTLACFIASYLVYWVARYAHDRYQAKYWQAVAFNGLWEFPNESPLESTVLSNECNQISLKDYLTEQGESVSDDLYYCSFIEADMDQLKQKLPRLNEWFNVRRHVQIDSADERISLELAALVTLFLMLPKIAIIITNFVVMFSGHGRKVQLINFLAIWDLLFISYMVIQTLALTLAFNELFDRNAEHLKALKEHINIASAQQRVRLAHTCDRTSSMQGPESPRKKIWKRVQARPAFHVV